MTERLWWWLLVALTLWVVAGVLAHRVVVGVLDAQPRTVTLAIGRFGGTDVEIEGCYFSIGQGAMLALNPTGDPCVRARELIGRTGTLMFVSD